MSCRYIQPPELEAFVDGESPPGQAERIRQHLQHCRECQQQAAALAAFSRQTARALQDALQFCSAPPNFVGGVLQAHYQQTLRQRLALLASAAILFVGLGLTLYWSIQVHLQQVRLIHLARMVSTGQAQTRFLQQLSHKLDRLERKLPHLPPAARRLVTIETNYLIQRLQNLEAQLGELHRQLLPEDQAPLRAIQHVPGTVASGEASTATLLRTPTWASTADVALKRALPDSPRSRPPSVFSEHASSMAAAPVMVKNRTTATNVACPLGYADFNTAQAASLVIWSPRQRPPHPLDAEDVQALMCMRAGLTTILGQIEDVPSQPCGWILPSQAEITALLNQAQWHLRCQQLQAFEQTVERTRRRIYQRFLGLKQQMPLSSQQQRLSEFVVRMAACDHPGATPRSAGQVANLQQGMTARPPSWQSHRSYEQRSQDIWQRLGALQEHYQRIAQMVKLMSH